MKQSIFRITENRQLAPSVFLMKLAGDVSEITAAGQFVNIRLAGRFLRRPISVCDLEAPDGKCPGGALPDDAGVQCSGSEGILTIIYKTVGGGTDQMSRMKPGEELDLLTGLGNGYDLSTSGDRPVLLGGGVGVPPMYLLAKRLIAEGKKPYVCLGFNTASEVFYEDEFRALGCEVAVATVDGSYGTKGFVTDILPSGYTYFYCCGPEPMLKAVYRATTTSGQFSFEERMGCGFGACMGCTCETVTGYKRICKDGPVLVKEEILWK